MATKRKEYKYSKMITDYTINHFTCMDCPAKLFQDNPNKPINKGIGNINSNTIILLPTYISINEKIFNSFIELIDEEYKKKYNVSILQNIYITPIIKCFYGNNKYDMRDTVLAKCTCKTISEVVQHNSHYKYIYLGDSKDIRMFMPINVMIYEIACPCCIFIDELCKIELLNKLFSIL